MERNEYTAAENDAGKRLDSFLTEKCPEMTRSLIQKLIENGNVTVNDKIYAKNYKLKNNDKIILLVPDPETMEAKPENIPLEIVYEDDDLLVVNKPKNMVVHPAPGNYE